MKRNIFDPQHGIFVERDVLEESEWREDLDAADLTDGEREAAEGTLRRMGPPQVFTGIDVSIGGGASITLTGIRSAVAAMSKTIAAIHRMWPQMRKASSAMRKVSSAMQGLGRIQGQRFDLVIMDDLTSFRPRSTADQLAASGWYHAHIHPESLKRLVPDEPAFPPKIEGETVVPQLGRVCVDPRPTRVGEPIWPWKHSAPLPPDQMPESRTREGCRASSALCPPPRRIPAKAARGRHRKQQR